MSKHNTAAYSVLSDPNSRLEYDASLPIRDALVAFYMQNNPAKLDNGTIETIVEGWAGREIELFSMLNQKYEIAAHQGVSLENHDIGLPSERSTRIRRDSLSSEGGPPKPQSFSLLGLGKKVVGAVCCNPITQRCKTTKYFEIHQKVRR